MLAGKVTDYGDLLHVEQWLVKGTRINAGWHLGAPRDTTPADRVAGPPAARTGKGDTRMDLQADKQVPLSIRWTDELDNVVPAPAQFTAAYTVDDASIINLTDNGDGTANAAATGTLGQATVHLEVNANGRTSTGDLLLVVVPGNAERVTVAAGEPTEVTPDTP